MPEMHECCYLRYVRDAGGLYIADEVQIGCGRIGTHWWGFQAYSTDLVPDIVTIGKPIGNGHPLAALITRPEIAQKFADTGIEYFNTACFKHIQCCVFRRLVWP